LSRRFYEEAVRPILDRRFPHFEYAAALVGYGSEVLGYDDETSRDHEWGPRVYLFTRERSNTASIRESLADELPVSFAGFPTHFGPTEEPGTLRLEAVETGPVAHRVEVHVLSEYLRERMGVDPLEGLSSAEWLATPTQRLLELTAGEVFSDPIGELTTVRELLAWYPHDVWLYAMSGHWQRLAEYEHFVGRTRARGDELGSRWITASLVHDLIRLAFLQERRYAPYAKWIGTAYVELARPERTALECALAARDWQTREQALVDACEAVARRHNELGVTDELDASARSFWGRPFRVLDAARFVRALRAAITDEAVQAIEPTVGTIDAVSDNTPLLTRPQLWRELAGLYDRA
jgi:hypothetical protein